MHIVYAVTTCSDRTYAALFQDCPQKPAFQSQKYHRLLIEGLSQWAEVDVAATLPVNRANCGQTLLRLPPETEGGARYHYAPASRQPLLKALLGALGTYRNVHRLAKKGDAVFVDCLNCTTALFAQLAAKAKGCRCVGIVTDLPEMLGGSRPYLALTGRVIRGCTDYIFLTEQMNSRLNPSGKPHLVLEGHADISMADRDPGTVRKASPRVCLYAGSVCRLYGLPQLVEGFRMANLPDTRLVIYGPGDYVEELKAIAEKDPRVQYGGMLLSAQVVEKEMEASLLINPRPTDEEYVRYSFPSKTMEYMSTGTPVLMAKLPCLPPEYLPHLYLFQDETPEGIAQALRQTLALDDETLFQKGMQAREFVLKQRNNVIQAKKVLDMLEGEKKK